MQMRSFIPAKSTVVTTQHNALYEWIQWVEKHRQHFLQSIRLLVYCLGYRFSTASHEEGWRISTFRRGHSEVLQIDTPGGKIRHIRQAGMSSGEARNWACMNALNFNCIRKYYFVLWKSADNHKSADSTRSTMLHARTEVYLRLSSLRRECLDPGQVLTRHQCLSTVETDTGSQSHMVDAKKRHLCWQPPICSFADSW